MFKKKYKNLIYFQNGSIGDFLMTIFFLENIHLNDESISLNIIIPKNEKFLSSILKEYPYIKLILTNRKSSRGLFGILKLLKFSFSRNLVLTASTTGALSLFIKVLAKIVSIRPVSYLAGFDDGQKINRFLYNKLLKYDTKILYSESLVRMITSLDFEIKQNNLIFRYLLDENILQNLNLEKEKYIVFNPIAATKGRSLDNNDAIKIIKKIQQILENNFKVVLVGGAADKVTLNKISSVFYNGVVIFAGSNISELSTLLEYSKLFIGMDTGTSHIASFLYKKSLIIAQNGTPNWLPYYNQNATILYSIEHCKHNLYEGREHLDSCRGDVLRCIKDIPINIIEDKLEDLLL